MNNFGLYHNSQEKRLIKEQARNAVKIKVYSAIEYTCLLCGAMASLVLMYLAYLGV